MHKLSSSLVLGHHGCDRAVAEKLLANPDEPFIQSENDYDWLGEGVYFWEANPVRGLEFAREWKARGKIDDPYVIGGVIDPGICLDLMSSADSQLVASAFDDFKAYCDAGGVALPVNEGGRDSLRRKLDCAVINHLHGVRRKLGSPPGKAVLRA